MIDHRITFTEEELRAEAVQNNLPVLALAKFLRSLPEDQKGFFTHCRVAAVIPVYLPRGDFCARQHALTLDQDQLDWFLKHHPEFKAVDESSAVGTTPARQATAE